jgi:hypothetical protein
VIPAAIVVMLVGLVLMLASPQPVDLEREHPCFLLSAACLLGGALGLVVHATLRVLAL